VIQFTCDSCRAIKGEGEVWILGLAAEAVGFTAARREVNILSGWDYTNAVHPLAVHFCSETCKDHYINKLFGNGDKETIRETARIADKPRVRSRTKKVRRSAA